VPDDPVRVPIEAELDLHSFQPKEIPSLVNEYLDAAAAAGLREVRLVHGRGRGVQRGIVQAALERHPRVVEFWDDTASHLGATIARLGSPARDPRAAAARGTRTRDPGEG
jgi:dsDNA-specific endonuclease/ATPase MutS2